MMLMTTTLMVGMQAMQRRQRGGDISQMHMEHLLPGMPELHLLDSGENAWRVERQGLVDTKGAFEGVWWISCLLH